jgi:fumarate reductase flavoprotein subunit
MPDKIARKFRMTPKFTWAIPPEPIPEEQIKTEQKADVVIIGNGHAGTCAARAAAEAGASVIVVEQQKDESQWILGIGEFGYMNSRWQKEHGVPPVDIDDFVNDWQLRTNNRSNVRLIRRYAEHCGETFDWLIEPLSEEERESIHPMMTPQSENAPKSQNHILSWTGTPNLGMKLMRKLMKENQKIAQTKGAEFFFDTKALQLEKTDSRVGAVLCRLPDGDIIRIRAKKGILLAAGDYSRNRQMCEDLLTETADLVDGGDFTGHGWTGDGIRMGVWAGGRLEPRSHAGMGGNYSFPGFDTIGSTATLRLNTHGERYSNEGFGNHVMAAIPGARQPNGMLWGIFDSNILTETTYQAPCNASFDYTDSRRIKDLTDLMQNAAAHPGTLLMHRDVAGDVRPFACANTIEELAETIYPNPEDRLHMINAVSRYNELCQIGKDTDFGKESFLLHPIRKAPFFATGQYKDSHKPFGQSMKLLVTVSGLLTDEYQNVLGEDFEPIPGLYACGNCCGGRFGLHYMTSIPGQSISMAQTLGRLAGQDMAALTLS